VTENNNNNIDCIVVGHNEFDFGDFATSQQKASRHLADYYQVKSNSYIFHGKRMTYMELFNHVVTKATGKNPNFNLFEMPSLGVCYLKSYLQKRDFKVEIINFFNDEIEKFKELLSSKQISSVAITTTLYSSYDPIVEIVKFVRKHSPNTKIIVGGPSIFNLVLEHDTEYQDTIFELMGADICIIDSQGENTLNQVLGQLGNVQNLSNIPNLSYYHNGKFHRTARMPENNDMDENRVEWNYITRDLISQIVCLRTARSCPFACSFCNYPALGGAHVLRTLETVEYELKTLHEIGTQVLIFIDDSFNIPIVRFKQLLRMMIRNQFNFQWISFLRCSNVDEETLNLMKQSGCIGVFLGIESGDQTILKNMNKKAKIDKYKWAIGELTKRHINTFVNVLCGFPGETEQSVMNTLNFIEESKPTFYNVSLFYYNHSAPVHKKAAEFALTGVGRNWKHCTMDSKEAADWSKYMFNNIKNSIPCVIYGFGYFGWAYLISKGFSIEQAKTFGELTRNLLLNSLDDDFSVDSSLLEQKLINLFRHTQT